MKEISFFFVLQKDIKKIYSMLLVRRQDNG